MVHTFNCRRLRGPALSGRLTDEDGLRLGRPAEQSTELLVPATVMPVAAEVGGVVGHHDQVESPRRNCGVAAGAYVTLAGGVRLYRRDRYPRIAHASKTRTITIVPTTRATSSGDLRAGRKGLNPIGGAP